MRLNKTLQNILLVIISTAISLYIANAIFFWFMAPKGGEGHEVEAISSADAYDNEGETYGMYDTIAKMQWHPYVGYIPVSDYKGNGYYTNRQSFRYSENILPIKEKDEVRIFITGGSTAWGAGVKQSDLYTNVAEEILNKECSGAQIKIISAGVGGYVSTQEANRMVHEISYLSPDVVVMLSGVNDTYAGYRGWKIEKNYDPFNIANYLAETGIKLQASKDYFNPSPPTQGEYGNMIEYTKALNAYKEELFRDKKEVSNVLVHNIHTLHNSARDVGADFVFYLQPYLYKTSKPLSEFEQQTLAQFSSRFYGINDYSQAVYDELRKNIPQDAKERNYHFFDADNAIKEEARSLFVDHCHFGDRGYRLIGEDLANILRPLLKQRQVQCLPRTKQ